MMDFFYEKKDFFQLKEIERLCYKEKGINAMSVKDVLMSLVHDGMVHMEKIGTCVYFWAFPSKAAQELKNTVKRLKNDIHTTHEQVSKLKHTLEEASTTRQDTDERRELLEKLCEKKTSLERYNSELQDLRKCDPQRLEELKTNGRVAVDAANRWTDNVFVVQSWLTRKFPLNEATFRKQFNIPENFDYIE